MQGLCNNEGMLRPRQHCAELTLYPSVFQMVQCTMVCYIVCMRWILLDDSPLIVMTYHGAVKFKIFNLLKLSKYDLLKAILMVEVSWCRGLKKGKLRRYPFTPKSSEKKLSSYPFTPKSSKVSSDLNTSSTTWKYCSIAFIWMVTHQGFIHRQWQPNQKYMI